MNKNKIDISYHSGVYTLKTQMFLPIRPDVAWDFFSNPGNLAKITPAEMGFQITSGEPQKMFPGQIITYKIGIFPYIKNNWVTEITQVNENQYFIDEQRFGPYKMWHHEHHFNTVNGGVAMTDRVTFKIPFGIIGRMAYSLFIRRKLLQIFSFRTEILSSYFK
jgi:ligand-binding SRPBCC domain-containing protein